MLSIDDFNWDLRFFRLLGAAFIAPGNKFRSHYETSGNESILEILAIIDDLTFGLPKNMQYVEILK